MNHKNKYLIALIVSMWMSVITTLEGFRPMFNQQPLNNDFEHGESSIGKKWALLVAGSSGYENYRHQADICHAYQILKKGGLEDENIIVFMYDDIAYNSENPRPGVIINHPNGSDVSHGVPKDYTRYNATGENFFGVLRGNTSAVKGGSGKVLKSGPNDIVFIYYTDHGSSGLIGMPDDTLIYGIDIVNTLKDLYAAKSYKKMVIYVEACESGSLFEGLLPNDINIYVTTASNATEDSSPYYCPPPSPPLQEDLEYTTCLGDLYSISWMEDSDKHDMNEETLKEQYENVRRRTLAADLDKNASSHVMQYGDIKMNQDFLFTYFGEHHTNFSNDNNAPSKPTRLVSQRDAHLLHLMHKLENAPDGSQDKLKAQKELDIERAHREHVDNNVHLIGDILFGEKKSSTMMFHVRPSGLPLVDDWDCFKTLIKTYENHCGILSTYGRKYTRVFANMCNAGISEMQLVAASLRACPKTNHTS